MARRTQDQPAVGGLRDEYDRRQFVVCDVGEPPEPTDLPAMVGPTDADGREQIVLMRKDGSSLASTGGGGGTTYSLDYAFNGQAALSGWDVGPRAVVVGNLVTLVGVARVKSDGGAEPQLVTLPEPLTPSNTDFTSGARGAMATVAIKNDAARTTVPVTLTPEQPGSPPWVLTVRALDRVTDLGSFMVFLNGCVYWL